MRNRDIELRRFGFINFCDQVTLKAIAALIYRIVEDQEVLIIFLWDVVQAHFKWVEFVLATQRVKLVSLTLATNNFLASLISNLKAYLAY